MKTKYRLRVGRNGEEFAASMLTDMGFIVLAKNYRCQYGEVDIIARRGYEIHFVEVKTRVGNKMGHPEEAVDAKKLESMIKASKFIIDRMGLENYKIVYDVMAIEINWLMDVA